MFAWLMIYVIAFTVAPVVSDNFHSKGIITPSVATQKGGRWGCVIVLPDVGLKATDRMSENSYVAFEEQELQNSRNELWPQGGTIVFF